jgi:prephenate dehydrogenase
MNDGKDPADVESIVAFWESIGMKSYRMDSADHDGAVAVLSHAPHFLSSLIALWAGSSPLAKEHSRRSPIPLSGGGFRDMVRIAGSNPGMWTDIFRTNRGPILASLKEFEGVLGGLIEMLEENGEHPERIAEWMQSARRERNRLCGYAEDQ